MRHGLALILLIPLLAVSAGIVEPPGVIYIVTQDLTEQPGSGNQVGVLNPETGETAPKPLPVTVDEEGNQLQMFDNGVDHRGVVWGIDSTHRLWTIEPDTGVSTLRGERFTGVTPEVNFNGMTIHPATGEIYLSVNVPESSRFVYKLNPSVDCGRRVCLVKAASTLLPVGSMGDIAFHYVGGELCLFLAGDDGHLYRLTEAGGTWSVEDQSEEELTSYFTVKALVSTGAKLFAGGDLCCGTRGSHAVEEVDPKTLRAVPDTLVRIKGTGKLRVAGMGSDILPPANAKQHREPVR